MKFSLIVVMLILLTLCAKGQQNLVPNHSFEILNECPSHLFDWQVTDWINPNGTSTDNFNACAPPFGNHSAGVPCNAMGYQFPRDGNGYIGVLCFSTTYPNIREYAQTEMYDTLTQGIRYRVGFYASCANRARYAISTLGAALTKNPPPVVSTWHPDGMLDAVPQVLPHGRLPLTDTAKWVLISDTVLAQGGERYLTIGNFHLDGESDTVLFNPNLLPTCVAPATYANYSFSHYYIDSVFVYAVDSVPNSVVKPDVKPHDLLVYPNPNSGEFTLILPLADGEVAFVEVYGLLGERVFSAQVADRGRSSVTLPNIPPGIYAIRVTVGGELRHSEKLIIVR